MRSHITAIVVGAAILIGGYAAVQGGGGGFTCTTTLSSGGNVTTALNSVASGGTVCLNAGTYSSLADGPYTKSSETTIRPSNGLTRADVSFGGGDLRNSQNITIRDVTITGGVVIGWASTARANHVKLLGNLIAGDADVCVWQPGNGIANEGNLIDGNLFQNNTGAGGAAGCGYEGRVSVGVGGGADGGTSTTYGSGVTISNNVCDGPASGTTAGVDCIQLVGGPRGVTIRGNEFKNLNESACSTTHCDPFQYNGADYTWVDGNYFHNNSSGYVDNDCNGDTAKITNNVWVNSELSDNLVRITSQDAIFDHNVIIGAPLTIGLNTSSAGCPGAGHAVAATITNNYAQDGLSVHTENSWSRTGTLDHNMGGMGGTNQIAGTPTFVGGASPSTWAGFALASGSAGENAASDGLDIGINP